MTSEDKDYLLELMDREFIGKRKKGNFYVDMNLTRLERSNTDSKYKVYGCFDDEGNILSAMSVHFWDAIPLYTIFYMLIHPKFQHKKFNSSFEESGLTELMTTIIKLAEADNRFQFYYVTHLKNFKTRKNAWFEKCSYLVDRYHWYVDCVIPANTLPLYDIYAKIIYNQPQPHDMVVKTARLKPDLAIDNLYEKNLFPMRYQDIYPEKYNDQ